VGFASDAIIRFILKTEKLVKHVIVIEPELGVFHATIRRHYVADLLKDKRFDFLIGVPFAELAPTLFKIFGDFNNSLGSRPSTCQAPEIIADPFLYGPGKRRSSEELSQYTYIITDTVKQLFTSMGCAADSYARVLQTLRNEKNLIESYKINGLYNKFPKVPAIIVGAGPSLEEFLVYAKENELDKKSLIIACDAALRRLSQEGIRPHIVVRCERKYTQIFDGVDKEMTKDVFYAAYPWTPPEFFELFDEKFMLFRNNGICKWTALEHAEVNGGVSACNAALELAFNLGCENIFLTGIDLCFVGEKSHASGTVLEFDLKKSKPKWSKVKTNSGDEATTIPIWHRCLCEYVQALVKYQGKRAGTLVFNTSKNGAEIFGAEYKPWNDLTKYFKREYSLTKLIKDYAKEVGHAEKLAFEKSKARHIEYLKDFLKETQRLFLFLDDALTTAIREEHKIISQLKCHVEPAGFWKNVDTLSSSMGEIYRASCDQIDQYKTRFYPDITFSNLLLDLCQLDLFTTENKANTIQNTMKLGHERMKYYIAIHKNLFKIFEYYAREILDNLQNGVVVAPLDNVPMQAMGVE